MAYWKAKNSSPNKNILEPNVMDEDYWTATTPSMNPLYGGGGGVGMLMGLESSLRGEISRRWESLMSGDSEYKDPRKKKAFQKQRFDQKQKYLQDKLKEIRNKKSTTKQKSGYTIADLKKYKPGNPKRKEVYDALKWKYDDTIKNKKNIVEGKEHEHEF